MTTTNKTTTTKKKFKTKSFATMTIAWMFLIMTFSGVILYFTPSGRIANWTNWTLLGLLKEEWQGLHNLFAILFVLFIVLHLFFNWKVFMSYFKSKAVEGIRLKREFALSTAIIAIFFVIALFQVQPFWKLMDWREDIKHSERGAEVLPPPSLIQDMTITDIAVLLNIPADEMLRRIKDNGYVINNTDLTFIALAEQNNTTPEKLSNDIMSNEEIQLFYGLRGGGGSGVGRGSTGAQTGSVKRGGADTEVSRNPGYGRKTIKELCEEAGITVVQGLENLKSNGIDAVANDRVKSLAAKYDLRPVDIAQYLAKK